jgi:hypothetical protein
MATSCRGDETHRLTSVAGTLAASAATASGVVAAVAWEGRHA